jgi:hypothetical protein
VTTTSRPYSPPCVMRLISQIRKTLSRSSTVFPGRPKSLRSCCSTSAIAVTLSNRMQRIRNSVRDLYPFSDADLNLRFSGKRTLKNIGGQVDKKVEDFRTTLLELTKLSWTRLLSSQRLPHSKFWTMWELFRPMWELFQRMLGLFRPTSGGFQVNWMGWLPN